jgi:ribosomal protein L37AE/L43A
MSDKYVCVECDGRVHPRRWELGYKVCLDCGELSARSARASWCVAPAGHKQGYTLVTNPRDLRGMNPKRNEM